MTNKVTLEALRALVRKLRENQVSEDAGIICGWCSIYDFWTPPVSVLHDLTYLSPKQSWKRNHSLKRYRRRMRRLGLPDRSMQVPAGEFGSYEGIRYIVCKNPR